MVKVILTMFMVFLLSSCTLNTQPSTERTTQNITQTGNCTNCAVSGTLYIPEHNNSRLKVEIIMFEYDPTVADDLAKEFDKIIVYIDQNIKEINFDIGQTGNVKSNKKYYISSTGYVDDLYVFWGKCSHGDFCAVLEPSRIEIYGEIQNKVVKTVLNKDGLNQNNTTTCQKDSDCRIVRSGCPFCHSCYILKLDDPDLIAVNENYTCPEKPKDIVCATCAAPVSKALNPENAICVQNTCVKK